MGTAVSNEIIPDLRGELRCRNQSGSFNIYFFLAFVLDVRIYSISSPKRFVIYCRIFKHKYMKSIHVKKVVFKTIINREDATEKI
jgi:hypothetical protein